MKERDNGELWGTKDEVFRIEFKDGEFIKEKMLVKITFKSKTVQFKEGEESAIKGEKWRRYYYR